MRLKKLFYLISILLFLLFILFSYLVAKETYVQFDFDITVKLQDHLPRRLDLPFSLFSLIGMAEITGFIWLIFLFVSLIKKYFLTVIGLSSFILATIIEIYGKLFVFHPAPPFLFYRGVLDFNFPTQYIQTNYSYPSGHSTRTAFLIFFLSGWIIIKSPLLIKAIVLPILFGILILMFLSRVYLGEHWTTDVIGGLLLGSSFGLFSAALIPLRHNKSLADQIKEENIILMK